MYFCFKKRCLVEHKKRSIFRCCGNPKTLSVTGEIRNYLGTNCVRLQVIAKRTLKCLNSTKSLDRAFCSLKCVRWQIMRCFSFRVIFALFLEKASGLCVTSLFVTSSNKILTEISDLCHLPTSGITQFMSGFMFVCVHWWCSQEVPCEIPVLGH